jgi:hypothetical protein
MFGGYCDDNDDNDDDNDDSNGNINGGKMKKEGL